MSSTSRSRNRARQRRIRKIKAIAALISMLALIVALIFGIVVIIKQNNKGEKGGIVQNQKHDNTEVQEDTTKDFSLVSAEGFTVTDFYYYGTHFNFKGTMPYTAGNDGITIKNVMARVYKTNKVGLSTDITEVEAKFDLKNDVLTVQAASVIDEGINLEQVGTGEYIILVAIKDSLDNTYIYPLKDESGKEDLLYYSITKDGENRKMDISNKTIKDDNGVAVTTFVINSESCVLPADVYDIVIDPGHGSADGGAESKDDYLDENGKKYNERDIALKYSKELKEMLEAKGYRVRLTHDGSEGTNEYTWTPSKAFKEGNRVWNVCESRAKYSISIHLNTEENMKKTKGVEVYSSVRSGTRLASALVKNITTYTTMPTSGLSNNAVNGMPGVYKYRSNDDPNTDYLYMIREIGGTITGANVVNSKYGTNEFYTVNYGPEGYLIETGYITDKGNLDIILGQQTKYVSAICDAVVADIEALQAE